MELEDSKRDSARLTWLIAEALEGRHHLARAGVDQHGVRAYLDHHMAPANADAERALKHEEMRAAVPCATAMQVYDVFMDDEASILGHAPGPDRDAAIDKARGVK
jgi:hypothetical protein